MFELFPLFANTITLNAGSGGDKVGADDGSGSSQDISAKYQMVKLVHGALGTNTVVSATNPIPITFGTSVALPAGTNNIGDVDVLTLPSLPAGNNNIGDVDIASIAAGNNNIGDVDIASMPSLPAGSNNIGDVDVLTLPSIPAGNNNIGDVDIASMPSLPAGSNLIGDVGIPAAAASIAKAEDSASVNGDVGVPFLAIRKTIPTDLSGTDGDYEFAQIKNGRVWVSATIDASLPAGGNNIGDVDVLTLPALPAGVNNIGSVNVPASALSIAKAEDAASANADVGVPFMAVQKATPADTAGADGDYEFAQIKNGRVWVSAAIDTALPTGNNNIGDVDIASIAAGNNNIGDVDIASIAAGTNVIGKTVGVEDVANAMNGTTSTPVLYAKLSTASTGNQALIAANASKKFVILALHIICTAGTNSIYINDGTADFYGDSTRKIPLDVTGATGGGSLSLPYNPKGWFITGANNRALNINLGSANGIIAIATYVEV